MAMIDYSNITTSDADRHFDTFTTFTSSKVTPRFQLRIKSCIKGLRKVVITDTELRSFLYL